MSSLSWRRRETLCSGGALIWPKAPRPSCPQVDHEPTFGLLKIRQNAEVDMSSLAMSRKHLNNKPKPKEPKISRRSASKLHHAAALGALCDLQDRASLVAMPLRRHEPRQRGIFLASQRIPIIPTLSLLKGKAHSKTPTCHNSALCGEFTCSSPCRSLFSTLLVPFEYPTGVVPQEPHPMRLAVLSNVSQALQNTPAAHGQRCGSALTAPSHLLLVATGDAG